jgi:hypothetical protein
MEVEQLNYIKNTGINLKKQLENVQVGLFDFKNYVDDLS